MRTDTDDSNPTKLGNDAFNSSCSPDGKWAIYSNVKKYYRVSMEGGTPVEIPGSRAPPVSIQFHLTEVRLPTLFRKAAL
jgi:hypothetical protein